MNEPSKTRTAKGLSVEGFWRELQDKTASKDSEPHAEEVCMVSDEAAETAEFCEARETTEYRESPEPSDSWESRLDNWLDRL